MVRITYTIDQAKQFFNPGPALSEAERKERRFLNRYGALVRRDARQSMRRRVRTSSVSPPGMPPRAHRGDLKKFLFFVVDRGQVTIAPAVFRLTQDNPAIQEFGGTKKFRRTKLISNRRFNERRGTVVYARIKAGQTVKVEQRPYLRPAKERVDKQLNEIWDYAMR